MMRADKTFFELTNYLKKLFRKLNFYLNDLLSFWLSFLLQVKPSKCWLIESALKWLKEALNEFFLSLCLISSFCLLVVIFFFFLMSSLSSFLCPTVLQNTFELVPHDWKTCTRASLKIGVDLTKKISKVHFSPTSTSALWNTIIWSIIWTHN